MIGVVRKNPSRELFIKDNQLILKNVAAGNIHQGFSETSDWVIGGIDDDTIAIPAKYNGGDRRDPANYDNPGQIKKSDYPDN